MRFLFYLSKKYSIPIAQPLIHYLTSTDHQVGLFLSEKVKSSVPQQWKNLDILPDLSHAIAWNPDFVLAPGNFVDYRIPGIKVQLFHGLGIEKTSHYKPHHNVFYIVHLLRLE